MCWEGLGTSSSSGIAVASSGPDLTHVRDHGLHVHRCHTERADGARPVGALGDQGRRDLWDHPEFWIYLGYLLYFVTRVPIMGSVMYIWERYPELSRSMYMMFQFVLVVRNVLFVVACRKYRPAHA
jgi:hypothetical protein